MSSQTLLIVTPCLILFVSAASAAAAQHNNSAVCVPFPHFLLYCSRYFDANTVVYVDAVAFNYTKLNDEIKFLEETGVFGKLEDTCRPLTAYVACQYVYPRCNDTAQALVPVCEDSCLNFAQQCPLQFQRLTVLSASVELTSKLLNVNCTDQFSAFGSVNVDANPESCYNYYTVPMFLPSTTLNTDTDDLRFVVFSNDDTYTPFCSELQNRSLTVTCRVMGDPQPTIEIYGENELGNRLRFHGFFQIADERAIGLDPLKYGEFLKLHCQASNIVTSLTFSITLMYTCCSDDSGDTQYSIGQEFLTSNSCRCLCGDGGNITCDFSNCESDASSNTVVVIIVITVVATIVIVILIISVVLVTRRCIKNKEEYSTGVKIQFHSTVSHDGHRISIDSGKFLLPDIDVQESLTPIADADSFDCAHDKLGDTLMPRSHLEHSVSLKDLLASCQEEQFKLTPQIITNAMIDHRFKAFIKPYDCLTICETLGEGEFGKVFHGYIQNEMNSSLEIAVKTMKNCSSMDELNSFISESAIMKDFQHRNVLGLVGVSVGVEDKAAPYIIIPFMTNGNLKGYLKEKRLAAVGNIKSLSNEISYLTLVKICCDICNGMEYLAAIKFVHRDLAARNCIPTANSECFLGDKNYTAFHVKSL
ncbi:uncharacterized protein [Dysidea avara]|uniref:uncharacterized protein isoform X2 n=1 Tax=Dysidea avara TaxID=196820 RepID=UPI0033285630